MTHGILTARMAAVLSADVELRDFDILHDHGTRNPETAATIGRIASWTGPEYRTESLLSFIDIALVSRTSNKAIVLIEIEETTDKPKVLLGDVLAVLMGDGVKFRGQRELMVGPWTTLIVLAHTESASHQQRAEFLVAQLNQIRSCLQTPNASIGHIAVDLFDDEVELEAKLKAKLRQHIHHIIAHS